MRFYDELGCLQCGAPHTEEGELATYLAQDLGPHRPSWRIISNKFRQRQKV